MEEKYKNIINIAKELFKKNGIKNTSIEDIVKECKMSKSTFYKYFSTKDDLITKTWSYSNKNLLESIKEIDNEKGLDAKEVLKKKIEIMWEVVCDSNIFHNYSLSNFLEDKEELIINIKEDTRVGLINSYKRTILNYYGDSVKPIVWEIIFLLDSLIHEFAFIERVHKKKFEIEFICSYIIDRLGILIKGLNVDSVIIDESIFFNKSVVNKDILKKSEILKHIKNIKTLLEKSNTKLSKNKILNALDNIENEVLSEIYDSLNMDAMICFLEKEECINSEVKLLDKLRS